MAPSKETKATTIKMQPNLLYLHYSLVRSSKSLTERDCDTDCGALQWQTFVLKYVTRINYWLTGVDTNLLELVK